MPAKPPEPTKSSWPTKYMLDGPGSEPPDFFAVAHQGEADRQRRAAEKELERKRRRKAARRDRRQR